MGIKTLLNTISITLQNRRERNQKGLNKQTANATLPLVKGKKPYIQSKWAQQIQKFENQMKMLEGTESVKAAQP